MSGCNRIKICAELIYVTLLLCVWLAVSLPRLGSPIDLRWDASTYYILGEALAEGKGYRLLNEPGEIAAVQYPPLLPVLVSLVQKLTGSNELIALASSLRNLFFVLAGIYIATVYALTRRLLSPSHAFLASTGLALSYNSFLAPSDALYAELPYALVSTLFLLCQGRKDQPWCDAACGLLASFGYLLRTAGVTLLVAWVLESLFRRRYRQVAIRLAVAAVPFLGWQANVLSVVTGSEYQHPAYDYQRAAYYYSNVTYAENSTLIDPFRPELGRVPPSSLVQRFHSEYFGYADWPRRECVARP